MVRLLALMMILSSMTMMLGCRRHSSLERAMVTGRVMLDGEAIVQGVIGFYPIGDTRGPVAGASIRDGRYAMSLTDGPVVGRNRVEIHAMKNTGRRIQAATADPGVLMDETIEAVPDRYNTQSTLECLVKRGKNQFDFLLETNITSQP